jgi:hypothetical protein
MLDSEAFPQDLTGEIRAYLDANHSDERKEDQTDAQFYYTTRKRAFGPFKRQMWSLPEETRDGILADLQPKFELIMQKLRVAGNSHLVDQYVKRVDVEVPAPDAIRQAVKA